MEQEEIEREPEDKPRVSKFESGVPDELRIEVEVLGELRAFVRGLHGVPDLHKDSPVEYERDPNEWYWQEGKEKSVNAFLGRRWITRDWRPLEDDEA